MFKITEYLLFISVLIFTACGKNELPLLKIVPTAPDLPTSTPNQPTESFNFAVISDLNKSYGSTSYLPDLADSIKHIIDQGNIDLVLSTGDMVAGQKKNLNYLAMWKSFHKHVTQPLNEADIIFAPSPGNHDASNSRSFAIEREHYKKTFKNRSTPVTLNKVEFIQNSNFPFYYGFTYKDALFISLDATTVGRLTQTQFTWVKQALANNINKSFKVVFGHMPLLPYAHNRTSDYLGRSSASFAKEFEQLLENNNVDYFLSGHHHVYYSGHRKGNVKYISVPLLGTGTRKLLSPASPKSERGFLIFNYDSKNGLTMKAIRSRNMTRIENEDIPEFIRVPKRSSSTCSGCAQFPKTLFLPNTDRYLYIRSTTY